MMNYNEFDCCKRNRSFELSSSSIIPNKIDKLIRTYDAVAKSHDPIPTTGFQSKFLMKEMKDSKNQMKVVKGIRSEKGTINSKSDSNDGKVCDNAETCQVKCWNSIKCGRKNSVLEKTKSTAITNTKLLRKVIGKKILEQDLLEKVTSKKVFYDKCTQSDQLYPWLIKWIDLIKMRSTIVFALVLMLVMAILLFMAFANHSKDIQTSKYSQFWRKHR